MRTQLSGRSWDSYVFGSPSFDVQRDASIASFEPRHPFICFNDGGGGGDGGAGGGGGGGGEKMLPQSEVSRIVAKEVKAATEKAMREARAAAETELNPKLTELQKQLEEAQLAGKSAEERAAHERRVRDEADAKARKAKEDAITKERDDAKTEAQTFKNKWLGDRVSAQINSALLASNALQTAATQAAQVFTLEAQVEKDDDGQITSVIYGGQSYTKITEAAAAFLKANPHFAAATSKDGGSGARKGGAGASNEGTPLHERSRAELLRMSAEERAAKR